MIHEIDIIKQEFEKYLSPVKQLSLEKNKIINDKVNKLLKECQFINHDNRKLYIYEKNNNFIDIIEIIGNKYRTHNYVTEHYYNLYKNIYDDLYNNQIHMNKKFIAYNIYIQLIIIFLQIKIINHLINII